MMMEGANPTPYIMAAYFIGSLCTFGFALWLYLDRVRVERYLAALDQEKKS
jgi:hypothetical protein